MLTIRSNREFYAGYLRGDGIEIGALHAPVRVSSSGTRVRYVDYMTTEELRKAYPEVGDVVPVDVVCTAEDLSMIGDESLDFIIGNHIVEHLVNPLGTLELWRRKLRTGGILFMAFPGAAYCPDKVRPITPVEHIVADYRQGTKRTPDEHLLSFVFAWNPAYFADPRSLEHVLRYMWSAGMQDLDPSADALLGVNRESVERLLRDHREDNVHQHVFTYDSMKELLARARRELGLRFRLLDVSMTKGCLSEHIFILEATDSAGSADDFMTNRAEVAERIERFLEPWIGEKDRILAHLQALLAAPGVPPPSEAALSPDVPGRVRRVLSRIARKTLPDGVRSALSKIARGSKVSS